MTDQYIGIDLHQAFFQACAVSPTGVGTVAGGTLSADAVGPRAADGAVHGANGPGGEASPPTWPVADAGAAQGRCGLSTR